MNGQSSVPLAGEAIFAVAGIGGRRKPLSYAPFVGGWREAPGGDCRSSKGKAGGWLGQARPSRNQQGQRSSASFSIEMNQELLLAYTKLAEDHVEQILDVDPAQQPS